MRSSENNWPQPWSESQAPLVEAFPNQPPVNTGVFTDTTLGQQRAFGWAFHADPKITIGYIYS